MSRAELAVEGELGICLAQFGEAIYLSAHLRSIEVAYGQAYSSLSELALW